MFFTCSSQPQAACPRTPTASAILVVSSTCMYQAKFAVPMRPCHSSLSSYSNCLLCFTLAAKLPLAV